MQQCWLACWPAGTSRTITTKAGLRAWSASKPLPSKCVASSWQRYRRIIMKRIKMLLIGLLMLLSAGCTSKQIACQPDSHPEWVMQPMPADVKLIQELLEALEK